ncbi:MAG: NUDIX domain-containing protein [Candidatus Pacebacteria bacterium]|nr:NUDIX domain-containing protein [Candidatus Paceibacterota bacterium]
MKKIGIINEHNFSIKKIEKLPIRKKVRGLIFKNKNTLVCIEENGYGVKHLLKLPGGSIEKNESNIKAIKREILEETGYEIDGIKCLGFVENIRKEYAIHIIYYIAKTKGKKRKLELTDEELKVETRPIEIDIEVAKKRFKDEYNKAKNDSSLRDIMVFNELKKL